MSGSNTGFEPHYQRLVSAEQRRAILHTIGETLDGSATLGEIIDASVTLGFVQGIGELRLVDFADVLLRQPAPNANGAPVDPNAASGKGPAQSEQPAAVNAEAPTAASKKAKPKTTKAKAAPKAARAKTGGKTRAGKIPTADAFDERMSLDEAVAAFVPLVKSLGEATMQHLEEATGLGRRKLRFHVGQLVKHGHLTRHGMGRGTYYTA